MNLISNYKEFIELGSVNEKNIQFTMDMLLEFSKNKNKENQEFNFEIIKILAEFINSACKYFRNYKIHELKISPIKPPKDLIQSNLTINRNSNDQTLEIENKMNTIYEKTKNADENELKGKELKNTNDRSISSTSKMDKEKMLIESKKDMKVYLAKKKVLTKKSKLDRIMNLKVTKPSAPSVIKDYLNKSSDIHRSFSCKKSKNDESLTFQDEIRRAQKEIREMEATKTKIMMLYEKQVRIN